VLGQVHHMSETAPANHSYSRPPSSLRARIHEFALSREGQAGEISILMLIIILLAPLVILGALAFVLIIAYVNRVSRVTAQLESKPKPTVCPACGHKLVEVRKFCAECGASIWPPESEQPGQPDTPPEEPK
jgi:hypothetical protein